MEPSSKDLGTKNAGRVISVMFLSLKVDINLIIFSEIIHIEMRNRK